MRTDHLKTAIKLMEHKTTTKASENGYLTHQGVIDRIDSLETELGFQLFKRPGNEGGNKRKFYLPTDQGVVFLLWASQALAMLEEGRLEAVEKVRKVG